MHRLHIQHTLLAYIIVIVHQISASTQPGLGHVEVKTVVTPVTTYTYCATIKQIHNATPHFPVESSWHPTSHRWDEIAQYCACVDHMQLTWEFYKSVLIQSNHNLFGHIQRDVSECIHNHVCNINLETWMVETTVNTTLVSLWTIYASSLLLFKRSFDKYIFIWVMCKLFTTMSTSRQCRWVFDVLGFFELYLPEVE